MKGASMPKHIHVTLLLLLIVVVIVVSNVIVAYREKAAVQALTAEIEAELDRMGALVDSIGKNQADNQIGQIIQDCERRAEYEALLGELSKLNKKDLITMQNLHALCGTYYPTQKALMVMKLEQELRMTKTLLALLSEYDVNATEKHQIALWEEIVLKEQSRSSLFADQARLQGEIITLLISGHGTQSTEVRKYVSEAQGIMDLLNVYHHEVDAIRAKLN